MSAHTKQELFEQLTAATQRNQALSNELARIGSSAWLDAAARMKDILWEECSAKHQMSPDEEGWNDEYHLELTVSVRELRAFAKGLAEASNDGSELSPPAKQPANTDL